jgi:hypothetical protein
MVTHHMLFRMLVLGAWCVASGARGAAVPGKFGGVASAVNVPPVV